MATQIHDNIAKINKSLDMIEWKIKNDPECNQNALAKKREKYKEQRELLIKELLVYKPTKACTPYLET